MNDVDGKIIIGTKIDTKQFDAQIKSLEKKLNDVEATLKMASEDKTLFSTREIEEMEAEAEKLRNKIGQLRGDFKKQEVETNRGFDKTLSKLKRLGLSLFGIRSAYALVSKASSAYLSQDIELAQKLQNVWVGLGSFLAPALEAISDVLLKALGYINVFIKALTGIDYIARANAKALDKQANSQKNLNKQIIAGIDEVTNLQDASSDTTTSTASLIEIPDLNENVIGKLEKMAYWLKENYDWLKEVGIMLGVVFGISKISGILSNINLLTKGLASIPNLVTISLTLIGAAAIIATISAIKSDIKDLENFVNSTNKKATSIGQNLYANETNINQMLKDSVTRRQAQTEALEKSKSVENEILGLSDDYLTNISTGIKVNGAMLEKLMEQYRVQGLSENKQEEILNELIDTYNTNLAMIRVLEENGIETEELKNITVNYGKAIDEVGTGLGYSVGQLNEMIIKSSKTKDLTKDIYNGIKSINDIKLTDKTLTIYTEYKERKTQEKKNTDYSNVFTKAGELVSSIVSDTVATLADEIKLKWYKLKSLKYFFADGGITQTVPFQGVVYNPGRGVNLGGGNIAGEAGAEVVFPLQNSRFINDFANELANKMGGGLNTQLLLELNKNIAELANRPVVLNVNGKSFAQATYSDFQNEQKRQNNNTQIVRS